MTLIDLADHLTTWATYFFATLATITIALSVAPLNPHDRARAVVVTLLVLAPATVMVALMLWGLAAVIGRTW